MHIKTRFLVLVFTLFLNCPVFSKNIAVIPFQNITGDKEKNWIGAGFSETLTTKLVKVSEITVIERENLSKILEEIKFQYTGAVDEKTAVEKGKLYGADVIVFGSFQVIGAQLKITARFVDVQTRKIIDTAEANGNISDIFKLQDEIAFSLLDSLKIVLGEKEKEEVKINPTEDLTAYQWFSKGYEASTLKLYDKAIEYYTKAIQINPKYADAYFRRGVVYSVKELYDDAIEDFTKAIKINPKLADAYTNRGLAYDKKGEYDKAIEDCNKAIELNPKDADAYNNRGFAYTVKGEYDKAIKDCNRAIELNPKYVEAYTNRGVAYTVKGEYDKVIKDCNRAIELNPEFAIAYNNRGFAYYNKGKYDRAIEDYDRAIELNPKLAQAYNNRGIAYYDKSEYDKAMGDWNKAIELNPEYAEVYNNRGVAYYGKGKYDKAWDDVHMAQRLGFPVPLRFLDILRRDSGRQR